MRRVLERIRRLTVPRSVIAKLAELEARIGATDAAYQELNTRHQTLAHEHQALSARNDLLRQNHQALNALYGALQAEHQALEAESQSLNSRCKELQTNVQALRQNEQTSAGQHQLLQHSQTALNARHEALQSGYKILEIAHPGLGHAASGGSGGNAEVTQGMEQGAYLTHRAQTAKIIRNIVSHRNGSRRDNKPTAERDHKTIHEQREVLKTAFPRLYPIWDELFENARAEYEKHPAASLSVEGNRSSAAFGKFLSLYAHGSVLDVGCGIQEFPSYLDGLVIDRLAGIDPLASQVERKFEFVQGFAEFLPWENEEFDLVVAATSLDHVVSLDMALSEIKRVLRPGGYFVTWVGFVAGAKPYDPTQPNISPIDRFHLFHFDREWFVELMARYFTLEEEFALDFESHFFAFLKA